MRLRRAIVLSSLGLAVAACVALDDLTASTNSAPVDGGAPVDAAASMLDGGGDAATNASDASEDAAAPRSPSCDGRAGAARDCGPARDEDCCASRRVTGGTFDRSNDAAAPATVSTFALDRFEVTVGRLRAFVASGHGTRAKPPPAGAGAHPKAAASGWDPSYTVWLPADTAELGLVLSGCAGSTYESSDATLPANCIDWYLAMAFCAWDGGRLPSEAEWNFAAAGGAEQRLRAWGTNDIDETYAVYDCETGAASPCASRPWSPLAVGSKSPKGDGRFGHADIAGNVLEWNLDWYSPYDVPCADCVHLIPTDGTRSNRDYGFLMSAPYVTTEARNSDPPSLRDDEIGIRCARSP